MEVGKVTTAAPPLKMYFTLDSDCVALVEPFPPIYPDTGTVPTVPLPSGVICACRPMV